MPLVALALCLVYLLLVFGLRSLLRWRSTGSSGLTPPGGRRYEEGAADALFLVGLLLDLGAPLLVIAGALPVLEGLAGVTATVIGSLLFAGAIALALMAQHEMGAAWRTGVVSESDDPLVVSGPFALVRHPVYTATLVASLAVALIVPTALAVLALAACVAGLELQTRAVEEPHLLSRHGEAYRAYARRTGRFAPLLGRLRVPR
ncbi:MAG: isoprenylcysteine carboxylmethyltransferase family protein [Solirubrobacteraceae bacterium MAG38_C4-C5]|nr:isoprenylcysteine carboxylmethyltransferase family protein [Candidatus Siliceabacter maunaloa]